MPRPKSKSGYKTKRKFSCPYCDLKMTRGDLVDHIDRDHESMIPEGYNAARVVYDHINGKNYGTCFICGDKVYEWDEKLWRYKNLCNKPSCREAVHKKAMNNHLNDPEKQKIMLQGRKISGEYKFKDGVKKSYTGSYERKCLEFMDKVMNIPSKDIETPGPIFEYMYKGEKHFFITDIFYIPAMLVIDVKDGGDNPNNRPMEDYRSKQIEKEKAVIKDGRFNYLRLTNNNFGQFMSAIADIRYGDIVNDSNKGIYIHEGAMPPAHHSQDWIVPCYMQGLNTDDHCEFVFGNSALDKAFRFDKYGNIITGDPELLIEELKLEQEKLQNNVIVYQDIIVSEYGNLEDYNKYALNVNEEYEAAKNQYEAYQNLCLLNTGRIDDGVFIEECNQTPINGGWLKPLSGGSITSVVGYRYGVFHDGIDIGGNLEGTPIYAAATGVVKAIIPRTSCGGNRVYINVMVGGVQYTTYYYHLLEFGDIKVGDIVTQDTIIGYVGGGRSTSSLYGGYDSCTSGTHLHFGVQKGWSSSINIDPKQVIVPPGFLNQVNYTFGKRSDYYTG